MYGDLSAVEPYDEAHHNLSLLRILWLLNSYCAHSVAFVLIPSILTLGALLEEATLWKGIPN